MKLFREAVRMLSGEIPEDSSSYKRRPASIVSGRPEIAIAFRNHFKNRTRGSN